MTGGRVGHRDVAHPLLAGAVEMLVPGVERDREDGAGLPLEGDALAGVVPHAGRAAAVEDQDHLLVELALRRELAARRDLADIAVVGEARGVVVDVDAAAAAARPRLELDRAQVGHVMGADDVEAFAAHPAHIGRLLLGREFLCEFVGNGRGLGHAGLSHHGAVPIQIAPFRGDGKGRRMATFPRLRPSAGRRGTSHPQRPQRARGFRGSLLAGLSP